MWSGRFRLAGGSLRSYWHARCIQPKITDSIPLPHSADVTANGIPTGSGSPISWPTAQQTLSWLRSPVSETRLPATRTRKGREVLSFVGKYVRLLMHPEISTTIKLFVCYPKIINYVNFLMGFDHLFRLFHQVYRLSYTRLLPFSEIPGDIRVRIRK